MEKRRENLIDRLVNLREAFHGERWRAARAAAVAENGWFTDEFVDRAAAAICEDLLVHEKLHSWIKNYNISPDFRAGRVGIIAAGNIPMVGFYDVLCAVIAGHSISLKPSSKDRILMEYLALNIAIICDIEIEIVNEIDRYDVDYLIATGSDATAAHFCETYKGIPSIIRGSRHSFAVLTGKETRVQLRGLRDDIFLYNGLGCRSISHLFLPEDYDAESALLPHLYPYPCTKFETKATYERALCAMRGGEFIAGDGFILVEKSPETPAPIGVIGFSKYSDTAPLPPENTIQCTVGVPSFIRDVAFGTTQRPSLEMAPDGVSPLDLLLGR